MSLHSTRLEKKDLPDFGKMTLEEQRLYSLSQKEKSEEKSINEQIAQKSKQEMDLFRSEHIT